MCHYDGHKNPDVQGMLRLGSWNMGSMGGRSMEVAEELTRRRVDVCCLQETSWKGASTHFIGPRGRRFKFWWKGNGGSGGVGIALAEDLTDSVMEVRRKSDPIMVVVMMYGGKVLRLFSCYAP